MTHFVSKLSIAVLGASGGTGRRVVDTAVSRGHHVVAVMRRPPADESVPGVRHVTWTDVDNPGALVDAFRDVDVVISALGGATAGPTTVCTDGARSTITAMARVGVARLIVVSAYGVADTHDRSLFSRAVWARVGDRMRDKETMEQLISHSGSGWTIVRPPKLDDRVGTGVYRSGVELPIRLWSAIGRADLAAFLVGEAEIPTFVGAFPRIAR